MAATPSQRCSELVLGLRSGLRIAVQQWGDEHAPVRVLCLHGWLDNAASFALLAPRLVSSPRLDCRVVAMEFSGHGQSSHRARGAEYTSLARVIEVAEVAEALRWDSFVLVGHSMGAGVATCFAATLPDLVQKLVLVDGIATWPRAPDAAPGEAIRTLQEAVKQRARLHRRQRRVYPTREEAVRRYLGNNPHMKAESARLLVERGTEEVEVWDSDEGSRDTGFAFVHDPRCMLPPLQRISEADALDFCRGIRCPVLLFLAQNEHRRRVQSKAMPHFEKAYMDRVAAVRDISVVFLETSHHMHMDAVDEVFPAVAGFIADHERMPGYGHRPVQFPRERRSSL